MAKYCTNCGAPIFEGDKTCLSCGTVISEIESPVFEEIAEETALTEVVAEESSKSSTGEDETRFCSKCGQKVAKGAVICPHCGCSVDGKKSSNVNDSDSIGWGFLGFFFPLVGFILWLMWKDKAPKKAKKLGIGALIGACLSASSGVLSSVFTMFL